MKNQID